MPAGGLIDPTQIERFRADLDRLCPGHAPLLLAVSGGPDSMAMLALAHAAVSARVRAVTVDHRLRLESASEADTVADWCVTRSIAHAALTVAEPPPASGRPAWARARRYDLLARHALAIGAVAVVTAHHADDQAETFLMRANRGVGLAGLRGIPARGRHVVRDALLGYPRAGVVAVVDEQDVAIVRPLLGWRRSELAVIAADLPVAIDPTNADPAYERARLRHLLADCTALDVAGIARTAAHAAEADAELDAMRDWFWRTRKVVPGGVDDPDHQTWLDIGDLPRELQRRLAREAIRDVKLVNAIMPDFDMAANVEPLLDALGAGRAATQAGVLATPKGNIWRFTEAPPRRAG